MSDLARIGQLAQEFMDQIEADLEDHQVGTIMILAELGNDDENGVWTRCTDPRTWLKLGLVEAVAADLRAGLAGLEQGEGD